MNPIVPDSMEGALILSVIDFFLSFVVISFIGIVLASFPWINRVALWISGFKSSAVSIPPAQRQPPTETSPTVENSEIPEEHVAAISAAITILVGEHRLLHIEPKQHGGDWRVSGRMEHHHSHLPTGGGSKR